MSPVSLTVLALAAFALSAWFTRRFSSPGSVIYILDHPNDRSLHAQPVPRGGGLAILIAIGVCGAVAVWSHPMPGLAGAALAVTLVASVSFWDDYHVVPPAYRLVAHVIAAAIVLYSGFHLPELNAAGAGRGWLHALGFVLSALFIVWMINLYNFMDGMDGFAGGMAVFGFGNFAVMGWMAGQDAFSAVSLVVAAASAGFLVFNFPPARIFMGDVGSSTLGLLAATLSLWGVRDGVFPAGIALLVFSPFIADATVTLIRRLLRREKIWQAHKSHFYQQLVQAGYGHRTTVLIEYAVMLGCGATALWGARAPAGNRLAALAAWVVFYFLFFLWVSRHAGRRD
jgi:UDP-N-acetylmuramyl pentapeptide phosphotransferase/UDP-N-acetylglucosamine-1-phosphate transferase